MTSVSTATLQPFSAVPTLGPLDPLNATRPLETLDFLRRLDPLHVRYRSPEQFRHTFASTMLSRNAPLLHVQKQGGWSSATIMLSVYARWLPGPGPATGRNYVEGLSTQNP